MNLPNAISLFRLILVPIIAILLLISPDVPQHAILKIGSYHLTILWLIAGILFLIAVGSDWLDGYLARKLNQITDFGKFFDAVADKALTSTVLIILSYLQIIPVWMTLIFILRDFLLDVVRQILANRQIVLPANWFGKWKFTLMAVGLTVMIFVNYQSFNGLNDYHKLTGQYSLINQLLLIPLYLALILSIYSAFVYIIPQRKILFNQEIKKAK